MSSPADPRLSWCFTSSGRCILSDASTIGLPEPTGDRASVPRGTMIYLSFTTVAPQVAIENLQVFHRPLIVPRETSCIPCPRLLDFRWRGFRGPNHRGCQPKRRSREDNYGGESIGLSRCSRPAHSPR